MMTVGCAITSISWERVNLTITVRLDVPVADPRAVRFQLIDLERVLPVVTKSLGGGEYLLRLNVTNFQDRKQVPNGTWRFVPFLDGIGGEPGPPAGWDLTKMEQLDEVSRTFVYAGNTVSYIIAFGISEDDDPDFLMRTYQMFRGGGGGGGAKKRKTLKQRYLPRARRVKYANKWYRLARRLNPPNGKRILFASEMRHGIEGNLLSVRDRMVERGLDKEYEFNYSFRVPHTGTIRTTLRLIRLLAISDIVLIDDYFGMLESLQISPDTRLIQAWHAGSGFKAVGYSRFGKYGSPKLQNAHRKASYAITGSKHLVHVYAEVFGIEESAVIPTGLPRIDAFLDPARTEKVLADFAADYPQFVGKRVILFAPTFRGRGSQSAYYDFDRIDFAKLYEMCGDHSVILFRMHHFILAKIPIPPEYADRLFDFSAFPNTNDLLHCTDIMITDYSSIIYEFSLLERPMLFFAYDKLTY
ncbi:CDP-glycerol glycerophosphotransferase family protein, partial [Jatrophihabitans sp.]|uniref:CDP-glycerol glycerophosphotransferase family protein n=1 Tax=Jatrophihabitans sp. TaxID=1932789 RepID=UPI0030C6C771